MKIKGKRLESSNTIHIVLPRFNSEDIIFIASMVNDYEHLKKVLKDPKPPKVMGKGGVQTEDFKDKNFISQAKKNYEHRLNYMVLVSLSATPDLEWETVDMEDPHTWGNWEKELKESGFPISEVNYIFEKVWEVNSLDQDKLDEARERFLLMKREQEEQ